MFARMRPRPSRLLCAKLAAVLFLCGASYLILWERDLGLFPGDGRRQLAYLDAKRAPTQPYGRIMIDQNYQSLLHPSAIDSSLFRTKKKQGDGGGNGDAQAWDKGFSDDESACDNALLFMPHAFAHNGHASQLNNYLLAAMIATFTNRAMIILEAPPSLNDFKSNSQFGCPDEAWETVMVRTGAPPKRIGWNKDFPNGLSRLIKHPVWLSRKCPVPCQGTVSYEDWDEHRKANNITLVPEAPLEVTCANDNGRTSNVIALGGRQVRDYFTEHYKQSMIDRSPPATLEAALSSTSSLRMNYEWALRLGAMPHEARLFGGLQDRQEIWDYASAFMGRAGVLRFQPWIARDVEAHVKERSELPLDVPYDAIHVRRGDKLETDQRRFVTKYWDRAREEKGWVSQMLIATLRPDLDESKEYIPFVQYLSVYDDIDCDPWGEARLVYVATDDPAEVQSEIARLPHDLEGNARVHEGACHKFKFIFGQFNQTMGFHIDTGSVKDDCEDRYERNVAGIADLTILAKSDLFVGEYNSNWGRLVRTFRLRFSNDDKLTTGARPVVERAMKIAWGPKNPGPPGW